MSQTAVSLFWLFFDTLCPIALGYVLHARGLVTRSQTQKLITFNVRVIFTLLAFLAFWRLPLSAEILWIAPVSLLLTPDRLAGLCRFSFWGRSGTRMCR